MFLVFLIYRLPTPWGRALDYMLMAASVVTIGYWMLNFEAINYRVGAETPLDQWVAMAGVLLGIELARRVVGPVFVLHRGLMLLYGVYGEYAPELILPCRRHLPGALHQHLLQERRRIRDHGQRAGHLYPAVRALRRIPGKERRAAFLHRLSPGGGGPSHRRAGEGSGARQRAVRFHFRQRHRQHGVHRRLHHPDDEARRFQTPYAGAIEPAASIGGMFMPPIMGAGGFIMAELTGVPYSQIMLVALFPALMYFFSVFVMVHYEAKRHHVVGRAVRVHRRCLIFKRGWYYMLPLVVITVLMLIGYSPSYAAVVGLLCCHRGQLGPARRPASARRISSRPPGPAPRTA
jgi:TRAP-type uncharacterized transport system fused permease subunit